MEEIAAVDGFAALAQSARLRVFRLLVEALPLWLPAGEIAERTGLPPSTLSFHLDRLARAGLVRSRRRGRSIRYAADCQAVGELIGYLHQLSTAVRSRSGQRSDGAILRS